MSWAWWNSPPIQAIANAADFSIGLVGFVITLGGFAVGYKKLKATELAAEAAKAAAQDAQRKLQAFNASVEIGSCSASMKLIIEHLEQGRPREAARLYADTKLSILRIINTFPIKEQKLSNKAVSLNGKITKAVTIINEADHPLTVKVQNGALSTAHEIRDIVFLIQLYHERSVV